MCIRDSDLAIVGGPARLEGRSVMLIGHQKGRDTKERVRRNYGMPKPEGCASILWKSADKKEAAADAMRLTAERLQKIELVDEVLKEPLGGAHRDAEATAALLKASLLRHLDALGALSPEELIAARERRLAGFGVYTDSKA